MSTMYSRSIAMLRQAKNAILADYVTLFILAAEIVNKVLNIKLDVKKIYDFCYMHIVVANADEANMAQRVYDTLLGHY